jgi:hypothetical protein
MIVPSKITRRDFPQLADFLGGYLHEDYRAEYASAAAARDAFLEAADQEERDRFASDVERFLRVTESAPWDEVQRAWAALGAAWAPSDRRALEQLLLGTRRHSKGAAG